MSIRAIAWSLLATSLCLPSAGAAETGVCTVGSQWQLFVDRAFFEKAGDIRLQLHPGRKTDEKILLPDRPWESASLNWFTVMEEPGVIDKQAKYRMWYEAYDVPGWPTADDTSFCYAESRDGVHWTKPSLGRFEYQGSKDNNILFRQIGPADGLSRVHGTRVFLDPSAPPEARYKAVSQGMWKAFDPPYRITGMTSPDGLTWTRCPKPICDLFADSQYSGFWDSRLGKYVLYGRVFAGGNRSIGRAESAEFAHFPPLELVLTVDSHDPPNSDLYNPPTLQYAAAGNVYMMFPSLYHHAPDTLDIRMAVSRDGVHWTYPEQSKPFIPLGAEGTWDSKTVYIGQGMLDVGDEHWLYYYGSSLCHNTNELENFAQCKLPRAFSRVVVKKNRFVSVEAAGNKDGWFVTPPLRFTGNELHLNVAVRPGGRVRVGLVDEAGNAVPGRGVEDCEPITGDHLDTVIRWKTGADVGSQANRPTRLRIEWTDASLFGFRFVAGHGPDSVAEGKR